MKITIDAHPGGFKQWPYGTLIRHIENSNCVHVIGRFVPKEKSGYDHAYEYVSILLDKGIIESGTGAFDSGWATFPPDRYIPFNSRIILENQQ